MNDKGQIIKETNISDLSKISDIESITADENGLIFIASSLSENKKGKIKKSHRVLAVVSRTKDEFKLIKKIDLYTALENAAHINQKKPWAKYILKGIKDHSIDIEGMFCRNDTLYLGFKTPFINGESVILKIEKITDVLKGSKFDNNQVSIWQTLKLKVNGSSIQERISDLYYDNDQLYITGSISGKKSGSLWKFDSKSGKAIRSVKFDNMQPEGIATGKKKGTLMVCFDQGKNNKSKIYMMRIMQ